MKTDYGIKCEAYALIDTVNNEYLQSNEKLQSENTMLKQEKDRLRVEIEELKLKNVSLLQASSQQKKDKYVDLTGDDDDDVQIIESAKTSELVIEINDEEEEEEGPQSQQQVALNSMPVLYDFKSEDDAISKCAGDFESSDKNYLKPYQEIDFTGFESFIMSQI
jgi:hypothetical protein